MSNFNLFNARACNQLTEEQISSLEGLGDFSLPEGCLESLNGCGVSLQELLDSYPAFFSPDILPVSIGDKVLFIEDNWYRVVLYEALNPVSSITSLLNKNNWQEVCSVKNTIPPKYTDFASIWPLYEGGNSYSSGDVVFVENECGDTACAYMALVDVATSTGINNEWQKIFCLSTEKNTCGGYVRKKKPEQGYRLIKVGSGDHDYVEHPIPYKEYLGNIFRNCGCFFTPIDLLSIWFEGRDSDKHILNVHGMVVSPNTGRDNKSFLISDPLPEDNSFREYLNYRPVISKINRVSLVATWEYYKTPQQFESKTFLSFSPPGPSPEGDVLAVWFEGRDSITHTLNMHGLVLSTEGDVSDNLISISDPDEETLRENFNYRPAIAKIDNTRVAITWEYYKTPLEFKGKTLLSAGGEG
jgi:hypothetical protein